MWHNHNHPGQRSSVMNVVVTSQLRQHFLLQMHFTALGGVMWSGLQSCLIISQTIPRVISLASLPKTPEFFTILKMWSYLHKNLVCSWAHIKMTTMLLFRKYKNNHNEASLLIGPIASTFCPKLFRLKLIRFAYFKIMGLLLTRIAIKLQKRLSAELTET